MRYRKADDTRAMEIGFLVACEGYTQEQAEAKVNSTFVYNELYQRTMAHLCDQTDHRWVDESYGGPDSGCMAGHCRRCGYSFHVTLY